MTAPLTRPPRENGETGIAPGDVIALTTEAGPRYVQVTHNRPPLGHVVRAIDAGGAAGDARAIADGATVFVAIVELAGELGRGGAHLVGHAPIPEADRPHPLFRIAIRGRSPEAIYWWTWDGEALAIAPPDGAATLPLREVLATRVLVARLAAEIGQAAGP